MQNLFLEFITLFTTTQLAIVITLITSFLGVMIYYLFLFVRVAWHNSNPTGNATKDTEDVTVVVIIKDDIRFLSEDVNTLLQQEYEANYQVVLVDNQSTQDQTEELFSIIEKRYSNVYITKIAPTHSGNHHPAQRLAYTIGLKAAKYENVIFLSSDAFIASEKWLSTLASSFAHGNIVTTYCRILRSIRANNKLFRARNSIQSMLYLAMVASNNLYMVSESVFGIKKSLFFNNKGFSSYLRLNKGENDLFIQSIPSRDRKSVLNMNLDAVVEVDPDTEYNDYLSIQAYNSYTHKYYPFEAKLYLALYNIFNFLFWSALLVVAIMFISNYIILLSLLGLIVLKLGTLMIILQKLSKRTQECIPYLFMIVYDIIAPIEEVLIKLKNIFSPQKNIWI
ncbi:MAG: glycosyltransferase [Rikenellaceae bacterium]